MLEKENDSSDQLNDSVTSDATLAYEEDGDWLEELIEEQYNFDGAEEEYRSRYGRIIKKKMPVDYDDL